MKYLPIFKNIYHAKNVKTMRNDKRSIKHLWDSIEELLLLFATNSIEILLFNNRTYKIAIIELSLIFNRFINKRFSDRSKFNYYLTAHHHYQCIFSDRVNSTKSSTTLHMFTFLS